jgi:1-acyl-sn-glycerol-3-phosphate acyltransferase
MKNWSYARGIFFGVFAFGILRYLIAWFCVLICMSSLIVLMTGASVTNRNLGKIRTFLIHISIWIPTRIHLYCSGVLWINMQKRPDKCYKKYLGPDWRPKFDGAGIQIANHSSWVDIMVLLNKQVPSFVSKDSVRNYPGVGRIAASI